jgi:hypothetical protein
MITSIPETARRKHVHLEAVSWSRVTLDAGLDVGARSVVKRAYVH